VSDEHEHEDDRPVDVVATAGPQLDAVVVLLREFLHVSGAVRAVAMVERSGEGPAVVDCGRLLPIEVDLGEDRLLHLPHAIELDATAPELPSDLRQLPPFEVDPETGEVTSIIGGLQHAVRATRALAEALGGRNVALAAFPTTPVDAQLSITARADGSEPPLIALGDEEFELPEEAQD
jgi:hypothetical protein